MAFDEQATAAAASRERGRAQLQLIKCHCRGNMNQALLKIAVNIYWNIEEWNIIAHFVFHYTTAPVSLSLCLSALFSRITAAVSFPFTAHSSLNHKIHTLYIYTSSRSLAFFCSAKLNHYRSEIHYPANELLSRPPLINSNSSQPFRIVVYTPTHTQSYSVNQRVRILRSNLSGGGHPAESARA